MKTTNKIVIGGFIIALVLGLVVTIRHFYLVNKKRKKINKNFLFTTNTQQPFFSSNISNTSIYTKIASSSTRTTNSAVNKEVDILLSNKKGNTIINNIEVVKVYPSIVEKLTEAKKRMKVLRVPKSKEPDLIMAPLTLADAAEYLLTHVSMACPPSVCTEYDGTFYFSGGRSTEFVEDFSSGFAIKKGENTILTWE